MTSMRRQLRTRWNGLVDRILRKRGSVPAKSNSTTKLRLSPKWTSTVEALETRCLLTFSGWHFINFDDLGVSDETPLSDQYAAEHGVTFELLEQESTPSQPGVPFNASRFPKIDKPGAEENWALANAAGTGTSNSEADAAREFYNGGGTGIGLPDSVFQRNPKALRPFIKIDGIKRVRDFRIDFERPVDELRFLIMSVNEPFRIDPFDTSGAAAPVTFHAESYQSNTPRNPYNDIAGNTPTSKRYVQITTTGSASQQISFLDFALRNGQTGSAGGPESIDMLAFHFVNTAPVAEASSVTTNEDSARAFSQSDFRFSDAEGDSLSSITISSLSLAAGDSLQLNGSNVSANQTIAAAAIPGLVYRPAANANGATRSRFDFKVNDTENGSVTATMAIHVNAVNDVPVAQSSSVTTNEDFSRTFASSDFRFTDIEVDSMSSITIASLNLSDGDSLQLNGSNVSANQTIAVADIPGLVYTPAPNANGLPRSTFNFKVNDAGNGAVAATMSIHVNPVNDVPVAELSSVTTEANTSRSFAVADFMFSDVEDDDLSSITISSLTLAAGDTLRLSGEDVTENQTVSAAAIPNLVYTPAMDATGNPRSTFAFKVNDAGNGIEPANMEVIVRARNTPPEAESSSVTTDEDTSRSFAVADFMFSDEEDDDLSSITISSLTLAAGDSLKLSGSDVTVDQTIAAAAIPSLVYTPALNANGDARSSFSFKVNDSDPGNVAAPMEIDVTAVNDPPEAEPSGVTTEENTSRAFVATDFLFSDVEGDDLSSITISSLVLAAGDTLQLGGNDVSANQTIAAAAIPNLVYTPAANATGDPRSTFTFRVNDADPGSVAATMAIDVEELNRGSIHGYKFEDVNGNGIDDGEPRLSGVTIALTGDVDGDGQGDTVSVLTDGNGEYEFTELYPGDFTVTETPPAGSVATTPLSFDVTVNSGERLVALSGQSRMAPSGLGDLLAYYSFDGDATDGSSSERDGTVFGAELTTDRFGNTDSAYQFDGVDDYIVAANAGLPDGSGSRTLATWVRFDSIGGSPALLAYGTNVNGQQSGVRVVRDNWQFSMWGTSFDLNTTTSPPVGEWVHVAMVYDEAASTSIVYENGVEVGRRSVNPDTVLSPSGLTLGRLNEDQDSALYHLDGALDDVAIFGTALNQAEVQQLMAFDDAQSEIVVGPDLAFGNAFLGSIHGYKFEDVNGDGDEDDEPRLANVQITLHGDVDGDGQSDTRVMFTDTNGEYGFVGLYPGDYTVTETLPAGFVATTPVSYDVTLKSREELVALEGQAMLSEGDPRIEVVVGPEVLVFGNTVPGSVHGFKFEDVDGNGLYDANIDDPLAGVRFQVTGTTGQGTQVDVLTDPTDANGEFWQVGLLPGTYTVTEIIPDGFVATTSTTFDVTIDSREEYVWTDGAAMLPEGDPRREVNVGSDLMFGNTVPGSVHGFKFEDVDGNGLYDSNIDHPLAGVQYQITGTTGLGEQINMTTEPTDSSGEFWQEGLLPGDYSVTEIVPSGFVITAPERPSTSTFFSEDFESNLDNWTGKDGGGHQGILVEDPLRPGNQVLTFSGLNGNGDIFTAEQFHLTPGQAYRIEYDYLGLAKPESVAGDFGGLAGLAEGLAGRHLWYYGTAEPAAREDVHIDDGQWRTYTYDFVAPVTFDFGGSGTGSDLRLMFEDYVFSGGVAGDVLFDNITISSISEQASATFEVTISSREEYVWSDGAAMLPEGDPRHEVNVGVALMFGNTVPGSIHGYKFEDVNGNGVDDDEPRLSGVTITLTGDVDGDGQDDTVSVLTDADGEYDFTGLYPGDFTVTETPLAGSVATTPASVTVTVSSREELVALAGQSGVGPQAGTVPGDGLVALYEFDGDGTDTAGSADAVLVGAPGFAAGVSGQALVTNTGEYGAVPVGDAFAPGSSSFTVAHWFNTQGSDQVDFAPWLPLVTIQGGDFTEGVLASIGNAAVSPFDETYVSAFLHDGGSSQGVVFDGPDTLLDEWHHFAYTVDRGAGTVSLYLDGDLVASEALTVGSIDPDQDLLIGQYDFGFARNGHPRFIGGDNTQIDQLAIYGRALSADEIDGMFQDDPRVEVVVGPTLAFGNAYLGSIHGHKFEDLNGNGVDDGEPRLPGVEITLTGTDGAGNSVTPVTVTTDANGEYGFEELLPGNYSTTERFLGLTTYDFSGVVTNVKGTPFGLTVNNGEEVSGTIEFDTRLGTFESFTISTDTTGHTFTAEFPNGFGDSIQFGRYRLRANTGAQYTVNGTPDQTAGPGTNALDFIDFSAPGTPGATVPFDSLDNLSKWDVITGNVGQDEGNNRFLFEVTSIAGFAAASTIAGSVPTTPDTFHVTLSSREELVALPGQSGVTPSGLGDLLAYYSFDGDATDGSGHGRDGTVFGAELTTDRFGNPDSAYQFDGVDDYIVAANAGLPDGSGSRTLSTWVRFDTIDDTPGSGNQPTLLAYGTNSTDQQSGVRVVHGRWQFSGFGGSTDLLTGRRPGADEWIHIAMVYDDATSTSIVYENGVEIGRRTASPQTVLSPNGLTLGKLNEPQGPNNFMYHLDGTLDDVAIFGTALTEQEIQDLIELTGDPRREIVVGPDLAFGNTYPGSIHGYKFEDLNGDGFDGDVVFAEFDAFTGTPQSASGTLDGTPFTITIDDPNGRYTMVDSAVFDGTSDIFSDPSVFRPAEANLDRLAFEKNTGTGTATVTVAFDSPVADPTFHLHSFEDYLWDFTSSGVSVAAVNGNSQFDVAGGVVRDITGNNTDGTASGSLALSGMISTVTFEWASTSSDFDGSGLQISIGPAGDDPRLEGVTITLTGDVDGDGQTESVTTTTDSNGEYWFENLWPGPYTVNENAPAGSAQTTDAPGPINLLSGETYLPAADIVLVDNQFIVSDSSATYFIKSDSVGRPQWAADDFMLASASDISGIRFLGGWNFIPPSQNEFIFTFYADDGTELPDPQNVLATRHVNNLPWTDTGVDVLSQDLLIFEAEFAPVRVEGNTRYWVSIHENLLGNDSAYFLLRDVALGTSARSIDLGATWESRGRENGFQLIGSEAHSPAGTPIRPIGEPKLAFGNAYLGSIHGYKFEDLNGDGMDDGEPRLPGVTITLTGDVDGDGNSDTVSVLTDADGEYDFTSLYPGDFTVTETPSAGSVATTPASVTVTVSSREELVALAGQAQLGPQAGTVPGDGLVALYEFDGDGTDTAGSADAVLVGSPGFAPGVSGQSLVTNTNEYGAVPVGDAFVPGLSSFTVAHWFNSEGSDPANFPARAELITLQGGGFTEGATSRIGNTATPSFDPDVVEVILNDGSTTQNLKFTASDSLINAWNHVAYTVDRANDSISLYLNGELVESDVLTLGSIDPDQDLLVGQYDADFARNGHGRFIGGMNTQIDQLAIYDRALSDDEIEDMVRDDPRVEIVAGSQLVFGNAFLGSIHGYKFEDLNGNGLDDDEPRLSGVTITLSGDVDGDGDFETLTEVTNANGEYWFTGLYPGSYSVFETVPEGSVSTISGDPLLLGDLRGVEPYDPNLPEEEEGESFNMPSNPNSFVELNGEVFFIAELSAEQTGLWKTDGTPSGTELAVTFDSFVDEEDGRREYLQTAIRGFGDDGSGPVVLNGQLFFNAFDPDTGWGLWKSDGTPSGTSLVSDLTSGAGLNRSGDLYDLTVVGDGLFFVGFDDTQDGSIPDPNEGLWVTDGTPGGTTKLAATEVSGLTEANGNLLVTVLSRGPEAIGPFESHLWISDGTVSGTRPLLDSTGGTLVQDGFDAFAFVPLNDTLYFAFDGDLWRTDGTDAGTSSILAGAAPVGVLNESLILTSTDASGTSLWKSDGTAAGTELIKEFDSTFSFPSLLNIQERGLAQTVDGEFFFSASHPDSGNELWKTDGTEAGTVLVRDVNAGPASSDPEELVGHNGQLYFRARTSGAGSELWTSDGSEAGTIRVSDINVGPEDSQPTELASAGGTLYFAAALPGEGDQNFEPFALSDSPVYYVSIESRQELVAEAGQAHLPEGDPRVEVLVGDADADGQTDLVFGNAFFSSIHGRKFEDLNANGAYDNSEPFLNDWVIELVDAQGNVIATQTTHDQDLDNSGDIEPTTESGWYWFEDLLPGDYSIREVQQTGWVQSAPADNVYSETLISGTVLTGRDFGNYRPGALHGRKFHDRDADGIRDAGEEYLNGWTIELVDPATGNVIDTQVTHEHDVDDNGTIEPETESGWFWFEGVADGDWTIREVGQADWFQSAPATDVHDVTLEGGQTIDGLDFGNFQQASLHGRKFHDLNANGVRDAGEEYLNGWTVEVVDPATGNVIATQVTHSVDLDSSGGIDPETESGWFWIDVDPGTYTVREVVQAGWVQSAPAQETHSVTVVSQDVVEALDFGNFQYGAIHGRKFEDLDGDGVRDAGEPCLNGWTIELRDDQGSVVATQTTHDHDLNGDQSIDPETESGWYWFVDLIPGDFSVTEVLQQGWRRSAPGGDGSHSVTITSGLEVLDQDFGNYQPGSIHGRKFHDRSDNGLRDAGEEYLNEWTIELLDAQGTVIATQSTHNMDLNSNGVIEPETDIGWYWFEGLDPGDYSVREVQQEGWEQTAPAAGAHTVSITSGDVIVDRDFGNLQELASSRRFDFNAFDDNGVMTPTQEPVATDFTPTILGGMSIQGYIGVTNTDIFHEIDLTTGVSRPYGWNRQPSDGTSVAVGPQADLLMDRHLSANDRSFTTELGPGEYLANITLGSTLGTDVTVRTSAGSTLIIDDAVVSDSGLYQGLFTIPGGDDRVHFDFTGGTSIWGVKGLEIYPLQALDGLVDITAVNGMGPTQQLEGDGVTIDTVTARVPLGATVTVESSLGTFIPADDAMAVFDGIQITDGGVGDQDGAENGSIDYRIMRPTGGGFATLTVSNINGQGADTETTLIEYVSSVGAGARAFDFNYYGAGNTFSDYTGVAPNKRYTSEDGFGYVGPTASAHRPRAAGHAYEALLHDYHHKTAPRVFQIDVPNGLYEVTIIFDSSSNMRVEDALPGSPNGVLLPDVDNPGGKSLTQTFSGYDTNGSGSVRLQFSGRWRINGLVVRQMQAPLTVTAPDDPIAADGTSTSTFSIDGLTPGELYNLTFTGASGGLITHDGMTSTDFDVRGFAGAQVLASAATAMVDFTHPGLPGEVSLRVEEVTGASVGEDSVVAAFGTGGVRRFDFNTTSSPTLDGFTGVGPYDRFRPGSAFGWTANPGQVNSGTATVPPAFVELFQDSTSLAGRTGIFRVVTVPNTDYDVRVYQGRETHSGSASVTVEGTTVSIADTVAGMYTSGTAMNVNSGPDGILEFRMRGPVTHGTFGAFINGIDIADSSAGLPASALQPLLATSVGNGGEAVTLDEVQSIANAAIARLASTGLGTAAIDRLERVEFQIADLGGTTLGLSSPDVILIDRNAAGHGWFVDQTPLDDIEFVDSPMVDRNNSVSQRIDLLTVVMHELGHVLGQEDIDPAESSDSLMTATLSTGHRRGIDSIDSLFKNEKLFELLH